MRGLPIKHRRSDSFQCTLVVVWLVVAFLILFIAIAAAPAAAIAPIDASDVSYINISAPENTATQTVNITAIEGEDFAVSGGGTASITIEVGTSNPGGPLRGGDAVCGRPPADPHLRGGVSG